MIESNSFSFNVLFVTSLKFSKNSSFLLIISAWVWFETKELIICNELSNCALTSLFEKSFFEFILNWFIFSDIKSEA